MPKILKDIHCVNILAITCVMTNLFVVIGLLKLKSLARPSIRRGMTMMNYGKPIASSPNLHVSKR